MRGITLTALALLFIASAGLVAQSALAQLGLTETAARTFLFDELLSPSQDRRSAIAVAGTRAFLKLPRSARAAAATGLFAWARSYASSPALTARYAEYRRSAIPSTRQYDLTVEQEVKQEIERQLADLQQSKKLVTVLPVEERGAVLEQLTELERQLRDPAFVKQMQEGRKEERALTNDLDARDVARMNDIVPADPRTLFVRRLREFLDATADVDFETRTISLTGGPDGIEFIDPKVRGKHWMWHEAVIVGPEATAAARAAAQAWLKEVDR
jgi:hypothetical protein